MSDVSTLSGISGLSFDSTLLSPLLFFLPTPVTLSVLSLSCLLAHSPALFPQKVLQYFSSRDRLFLYGSCSTVRRSKLVGGMCSVLTNGTGIGCYAFI